MNIREAKISDLEQITRIYNWAIKSTTATFDINEQNVDDRMDWFEQHTGKYPLVVAEVDGKTVGYSSLSKFREKEAFSATAELSVYIDPDYHGKGIGKALMKEILEKGKSSGFHVVISVITGGNEVSARMHEKFGFELCGRLKEVGRKFDRWQDVLFYELAL